MRVTALESDKMAGDSVHHIDHFLVLDSSPPPRAEKIVELESMVKSLMKWEEIKEESVTSWIGNVEEEESESGSSTKNIM